MANIRDVTLALNADQIDAGGEVGDGWSKAPNLAEIRYSLSSDVTTAFRDH